MNPVLRRCSVALLTLPLMVLLAGCVKFDSAMSVSSDDKVDATMLIAIQKQFASMVREVCTPKGQTAMPNATITPYEDDDYTGCTVSAHSIPIDQLAKTGSSWKFAHENGQYTFTMANSNQSNDSAGMSGKMFTSFKAAVTFPGDVISHSGSSTVQGTTVTWTDPDDMFTDKGLTATAKEASPVQAAMPALLGLAGLLVVGGLGAVIWMAVRRRRAAAAAQPSVSEAGTFAVPYPSNSPTAASSESVTPSGVWPFAADAAPRRAEPGPDSTGDDRSGS